MKIGIIIYVLVLILLVVFKEGCNVAWGETNDPDKRKKLSRIWHFLGGLQRAFIPLVLIPVLWPDWRLIAVLLLWYCNFAYTLYDGWIAIRLGESFWYEGKTAETDKIFNQKVQTIFKIILLGSAIGATIIYLVK